MSVPGIDFENASTSDEPVDLPVASQAPRMIMTDAQFDWYMAAMHPPVPLVAPAGNRATHAMSDSSPEEIVHDVNLGEYDDNAEARGELTAQPVNFALPGRI